jgi:hypothetical protein
MAVTSAELSVSLQVDHLTHFYPYLAHARVKQCLWLSAVKMVTIYRHSKHNSRSSNIEHGLMWDG